MRTIEENQIMNCTARCSIVGAAALVAIAGSIAFAAPQQDAKKPTMTAPQHGDAPAFEMTPEMIACMEAGTPGEMHAWLKEGVGEWSGTSTMWMEAGAPPMTSEISSKLTSILDGRYLKIEYTGDMGGQEFHGIGITGFDNVSQSFQSTWIDSMSTGIMFGTGERSSDGTTLTWNYKYNCPVTKKPATMRQIETHEGNTMKLEMFGPDMKTGKEYKMMEIVMERTAGSGARASAAPGMLSNKAAEAGCALCSYHIDGVKSCSLAVKIDGKSYLATGSDVNCHQFCGSKGPKPATVSGKIVDGKFVATDIKLATATR